MYTGSVSVHVAYRHYIYLNVQGSCLYVSYESKREKTRHN